MDRHGDDYPNAEADDVDDNPADDPDWRPAHKYVYEGEVRTSPRKKKCL